MSVPSLPEHSHGRLLVDCGCTCNVYADGSGVELYRCPLHYAAGDLLAACQAALNWATGPEGIGTLADRVVPMLDAAIAAATGQEAAR